jgi:hypothetical protein
MQANAIVPMLLSIILMASGATLIVREVQEGAAWPSPQSDLA